MTSDCDGVVAAARALNEALHKHFGHLTKPLSLWPEIKTLRAALTAYDARGKADTIEVPRATFMRWLGNRNHLPKFAELHALMYPAASPTAPKPGTVEVPIDEIRAAQKLCVRDNPLYDWINRILSPAAPEPSAKDRAVWAAEAVNRYPEVWRGNELDQRVVGQRDGYLAAREQAWRESDSGKGGG